MAAIGLVGGLAVAWRMQPVADHLKVPHEHNPWNHLLQTVAEPRHWIAFALTALLTTGGFMLMPFSSAYTVNNLGIDLHSLPTVYLATGLCTIVFGPIIGKAADRFGKFRVFTVGTSITIVTVLVYTHLGPVSLPVLIAVNAIMFVGIFSRMIPYQALAASVPVATQRGSFNAISASLQQLSGGLASVIAGHIVMQGADGRLEHFEVVGYVVVVTSIVSVLLLRRLVRNLATPAAT
jgi:predicted MFS family arabinose efflux permease